MMIVAEAAHPLPRFQVVAKIPVAVAAEDVIAGQSLVAKMTCLQETMGVRPNKGKMIGATTDSRKAVPVMFQKNPSNSMKSKPNLRQRRQKKAFKN